MHDALSCITCKVNATSPVTMDLPRLVVYSDKLLLGGIHIPRSLHGSTLC